MGLNIRWTIRNKLFTGFGVLIALIVTTVAVGAFAIKSLEESADEAIHVGARLEAIGLEIELHNLEARRREKDFFLNISALGIEDAQAKYIPAVQAEVAKIRELAAEGEALALEEKERDDFSQVGVQAAIYERELLRTVELVEARGYKDTGAEGELRAAVHDIEGMIAGRNLDEVTIAMLQMRRTEKDYLLRGDEKYVSQIGDNVATLKQAISAAPSEQLTSAEKSEATGFADEYQAAFTSLVAANQAVAEATVVYKDATHEVDVISVSLVTSGHEASKAFIADLSSTGQQVLTILVVVAVAGIAVALAFAVFLPRGIVNGVRRMVVAAQGMSNGDLKQEIDVKSRDEIGDLATAFGDMQAYLSEIADAAQKIADCDLAVEVQPKSDRDTLGNAFTTMVGYLREMAGAAEQIADGDLMATVRPKSASEALGNAFTTMVTKLRVVIGEASTAANGLAGAKDQLAQTAEQAAVATQEVAKTTAQIAQGSESQADSVDKANQLGTDVATRAEQMAANADTAAEGAREAAETADQGAAMVQNTVDGMARIQRTMKAASSEIGTLGERSAEIGKIVAVIEDIAAQTNLLALNAAIEAARAGEQGRGFAVVADEVRQLAERVSSATKEIADLIGGVQQGVDASVKAMEEGAQEMETGNNAAAEAGQALQQILEAARTVTTQIQELAQGSQELKTSGQEMAKLLEDVSSVVAEKSAATEQASATAEEMSAQVEEVTAATASLGEMSDELAARVSEFRLADDALDAEQAPAAEESQAAA